MASEKHCPTLDWATEKTTILHEVDQGKDTRYNYEKYNTH
jgi:hypothetical protein